MKKNVSIIGTEKWDVALNFIKEATKLKTVALGFAAEQIHKELRKNNGELLYVLEDTNHHNEQLILIIKNVWLNLDNNLRLTGTDEKLLICKLYTSSLIEIGEIKFLCDLDGRGKVMVSVKSDKLRGYSIVNPTCSYN